MELTHDELLAEIALHQQMLGPFATQMTDALRAIVELHKPIETYNMNNVHKAWLTCTHCNDEVYPCQTIQAIEKELQ